MTQEEILNIITQLREVDAGDELIATVLAAATNTITVETLTSLIDNKPKGNKRTANRSRGRQSDVGKTFKISDKEIKKMPQKYHKLFACNDRLVPYRFHKGVYEAHYRRHGLDVFACAKDFDVMKRKFYEKLNNALSNGVVKEPSSGKIVLEVESKKNHDPLFMDYVNEYLKIKENTVKASTFEEYKRFCKQHFEGNFADYKVSEMTRSVIQDYLFKFVKDGKQRTAKQLLVTFGCIFDLITEDLGIQSPMNKIVLPYYEPNTGKALTKEEEKIVIDYCIKNAKSPVASALLVLLYFGLRRSELCTIHIDGEFLTCVTSKTKLGRSEAIRTIPFSPMFKKVLPYVDFDKARTAEVEKVSATLKKLLPDHHTHELRHTYISRAKEAGVNQEVVMLWAGHSFDKDVKTSAVDRGYTHYSKEYMLQEVKKIYYEL